MANALYAKAKEAFLSGSINLTSDTIKVNFVDGASYTPNMSTHDFLDDVSGLFTTAVTLASKTVTNGVFDAADAVFSGASGGTTYEYILIYKDTGTASTSPLIALFDTASGIPVTTSGGNYTIQWHASGIFAL